MLHRLMSVRPSSSTISVLSRESNLNSKGRPLGLADRTETIRLLGGITWPHEKVTSRSGVTKGSSCWRKSEMGSMVPPAKITERASSTNDLKTCEGLSSWYFGPHDCLARRAVAHAGQHNTPILRAICERQYEGLDRVHTRYALWLADGVASALPFGGAPLD